MNSTVNPADIETVLRNFNRRKDDESRQQAASSALDIASNIGTNTPTTLLMDLRQCVVELTQAVLEGEANAVAARQREEERHKELLAYISEVSNSLRVSHGSSAASPYPQSQMSRQSSVQEQRRYYCGGDELKTKESIVGCTLMQMFKAASNQTFHSNPIQSDATLMELKDWSSLVSIVAQAQSTVTPTDGKLSLIKSSSMEATTACELIASTVSGRMVVCRLEQLRRLQNECPTLAQIVEEVRKRVTLCHGLVSTQRTRTLMSMGFPFVTTDDTLNIVAVGERDGGSKVVVDTVASLNIPQKKLYASKVLKDKLKPLVAAKQVLSETRT